MQLENVFEYYKLPKNLTEEETISYFKQYENGSTEAREKLIIHNIRLVLKFAFKFDSNYEKDELIELGLLGLIKAVDNYDYKNKIKFSTYATTCIRNEILLFIKVNNKHNKVLSYNEIIKKSKDEYQDIYYKDTIPDIKQNLEENLLRQEEYEITRKIVNSLPPRDKDFISLYCGFYDGIPHTNQQIADIYNITVSAVSLRIRRIETMIYKELLEQGLYEHQPNSKRIKQNIVSKYQELVPKEKRRKTIYDYFPGYTKEQVLNIINNLPYEEQKYIYLKNGIFLDKPTPCKGWKQEYNNVLFAYNT